MENAKPAEPRRLATVLRQVGPARLALAFVVVQLIAIFAAEALLGPRGLAWFRGAGGAGGVGAAFGLTWAYLAWLRLVRAEPWSRALLSALAGALLLLASAVVLMHLVGR